MTGDIFQHRLRALLASHQKKSTELYHQHTREIETLCDEASASGLDEQLMEQIAEVEVARNELATAEFVRANQ